MEVVGVNGVTAYKISGVWQVPGQNDGRIQTSSTEIRQTMFIDAASFLVVRTEQITTSGPPEPLNSQPVPGAAVSEHVGPTVESSIGPDFEYQIEMLMDYSYPAEEFVIEPPEVTAGNVGIPVPGDRIDSTATPVQRQPDPPPFTPTAVVIPTP